MITISLSVWGYFMIKFKKLTSILISLLFIFTFESTLAHSNRFRSSFIPLNSPQGEDMLSNSSARNYSLLHSHYIEQKKNYCGIASMVIVLNTLRDEGELKTKNLPRHEITQDNFFTPTVRKILDPQGVAQHGLTLDEAGKILSLYSMSLKTIHANRISLKHFRTIVQKSMNSPKQFIIANFTVGPTRYSYGHFSPLVAYHPKSDSILVMDVADHRAVRWIQLKDLFQSMQSINSEGVSRGILLIACR